MKSVLTAMWLVPAIAVPYAAAAPAASHPAQAQMQQNIDTVLQIARDKSLGEQQKIRKIESYADRYLDYQRISAMAVGAPWKQFSPQQKTEFIEAFKDMMIAMYSRSALMGAQDAKVSVLPKTVTPGSGKVDVFTELRTASGKRYEVAYQLYQSGSVYKVYNIRVDGTSLVTVYRSQFGELIKQKGVDGVIATLKAKGLKKVH
ncbi:phospholipid-binding protein MlaC [Neisseria sp.]|uniref:MlaC/ttg2D family ABC transporter substrate-binding protein n=1 Tax=Neisseria sp. TaxID=192066 RepID=UPI0035A1B3E3